MKVAFAGLAHSHPYADAEGVLGLGAEVVAVYDADDAAREEFAGRFGGTACATLSDLRELDPDIVIATPLPHERVSLLSTLANTGARSPVFFNKVVAATHTQLTEWERAARVAAVPVGTASVLRFAPQLARFADAIAGTEILSIRVRVQHDNTGFQRPGRDWQDDPELGGGTLVTVGVHAWEMIDLVLPGAVLESGSGWTRRRRGSATRSEDAGGFHGLLRASGTPIPVDVVITGVPGPDGYAIEVVAASGIRSLELEVSTPRESLGYTGLARSLLANAAVGTVPAPWAGARAVVSNTVHAAAVARDAEPRGED